MNYWVCTAGRYRAISVLGRVHAAFFNSHQMKAMIYMQDEIILARMVTAPDLEIEKAMHYHDEAYESDNAYGLPPQVVRPVHICTVFTTEASFDPTEYKVAQNTISPFMLGQPRCLPFCEGVHQSLTFKKMFLPMPEVESDDEEYL